MDDYDEYYDEKLEERMDVVKCLSWTLVFALCLGFWLGLIMLILWLRG